MVYHLHRPSGIAGQQGVEELVVARLAVVVMMAGRWGTKAPLRPTPPPHLKHNVHRQQHPVVEVYELGQKQKQPLHNVVACLPVECWTRDRCRFR